MAEDVRTQKSKVSEYINLNEGDSNYHFLFDENPSVSFIINYERSIQDVNKKCCETLGYKKTDLVGRDPLDIIQPDSRYKISNFIDQLFNKEVVTDIELAMVTNDGKIKRLLFAPGKLIEFNKSFAVLLSGVDVTEAKKTLYEFEKSNELFIRFMNLFSAGVFIKDDKNECIFKNKFIIDNFDADVINKLSAEDDISDLSLTRFFNLKDKNSKNLYCEITTFKINHKDFNGYTGGIILDLTGRIEAERSRKESETIFKTVFENSAMGIFLTNPGGKILECNPSFLKLTGYTAGEIYHLTSKDITHPSDYENESVVFKNAFDINSKNAVHIQKRFITKNKEIVWANLTMNIIHDDKGLPRYCMQLVENITEKKIIKEALEKFEYRNKAIVSALPDLIFIINKEGYYLDYSIGNSNDLAVEESKLIGSNIKELFPPEKASYIIDKINRCISNGSQESLEYDLNLMGEQRYFEARIVKYDNNSVLGVVRNITEVKKKEVQLKEYAGEMEELNVSRNKLFSIIAHDLRSPFHALLGLSELLAEEIDDLTREEVSKIGKELYSAFKNEYRLLENLLAWSKIQKGSIDINPVELNLSEAVDETVRLLSWLAKNKKIHIHNLVERSIRIRFDANFLSSILQNIISNSLKFSLEESTIRIKYYYQNNLHNIEISDEGVGLSEEEIEVILSQESGYSKAGTAKEQGSGLGLVICKEFVEKHGGKLHIKSIPGKGTTVGFSFP
jgi:PAS domain S-box-containing protein